MNIVYINGILIVGNRTGVRTNRVTKNSDALANSAERPSRKDSWLIFFIVFIFYWFWI